MKIVTPYKNIKSKHLGLALAFAKGVAIFSILSFCLAVLWMVIGMVIGPLVGISATFLIRFSGIFIGAFLLSVALAALVAFEEGFRQRTEKICGNE